MPYVFTLEDRKFNTDDLTLDEAEAIEEETGESWVYINAFRSAKHFKAIARAFLRREGKADDEIAKFLGGLTINAAADLVEFVKEDDLPTMFENGLPDPKAEGEEATGT